jgi:hypothetical protein
MRIIRVAALCLLSAITTVLIITACGGSRSSGTGSSGNPLAALFIFNANPVGRHANHGNVSARASIANPFIVNAQTTTPGGGNFPGFCNTLDLVSARAASVLFGIGRWSDGNCADHSTPDSDVGVSIPTAGQIGNLTVDAIGTGTASDSGQMEVKVIHTDGSQTITAITCTLGLSSNTKVHCEDKSSAHFTTVAAGDQVSARIFWDAGDTYRAVRVNIDYATPTF